MIEKQDVLYGFFHNFDTYEGAPELISLHRSKRNAYKAMIKHQWDAWVEAQKQSKLTSRTDKKRWLKDDPSAISWINETHKNRDWRKAYTYEHSFVKEVIVQD